MIIQVCEELHSFMSNVLLPVNNKAQCLSLQQQLMNTRDISVACGSVTKTNTDNNSNHELYFVRISVQIYLDISDFQRLAFAVKSILNLN